MSFLLDPIEEGINSLLNPLTSGLVPTPTATSASSVIPAQSTDTSDDELPTTSARTSAATTANIISPTTSQDETTSSSRISSSEPTTITPTQFTSTSIDELSSSSSSLPTSTSTSTPTTLRTSTTPLSTPSSSLTTPSTPPAPAVNNPIQSTPSSTDPPTANTNNLSTAGIAIASIIAFLLLTSSIYLTLRFCPPIRRYFDNFRERRRKERTWREALDGPAVPEKDFFPSGSSTSTCGGSGSSKGIAAAAKAHEAGVAGNVNRPFSFSFFALGRNPPIAIDSSSEKTIVPENEAYRSPRSAAAAAPKEAGLGLGRVSLLRNHGLLRKAGQDGPPSLPARSEPIDAGLPTNGSAWAATTYARPQHQAQTHSNSVPPTRSMQQSKFKSESSGSPYSTTIPPQLQSPNPTEQQYHQPHSQLYQAVQPLLVTSNAQPRAHSQPYSQPQPQLHAHLQSQLNQLEPKSQPPSIHRKPLPNAPASIPTPQSEPGYRSSLAPAPLQPQSRGVSPPRGPHLQVQIPKWEMRGDGSGQRDVERISASQIGVAA